MIFASFILLVALAISAVAEYYSIMGLIAIFPAAAWPVVIMGVCLGVGKITATLWLKVNWARVGWQFKLYLVPAVTLLMVLTAMGDFGFLSKAHLDQTVVGGDVQAQVQIFDDKIKTQRDNIDSARKALTQMDAQVDQMLGRTDTDRGAERANQIRRSQQRERASLQNEISTAQKVIVKLQADRAPIAQQVRKVEAEVGPIKYIAALVYGDNPDANLLERAVRWVIILIVIVLDPLALILILSSNKQFEWAQEDKRKPAPKTDYSPMDPVGTEYVFPNPGGRSTVEVTAGKVVPDLGAPIGSPEWEAAMDDPDSTLWKDVSPADTAIPTATVDVGEGKDPVKVSLLADAVFEDQPAPVKPAYLDQPFVHFKDTKPMVAHPEVEPVKVTVGKKVVEAYDMPSLETEPEDIPMKEQVEEYIDPNTRVKTLKHSWVPDLSAKADGGHSVNAGFGTSFPQNPGKGDLYLRVDHLPNKLYKFNGAKWIEIDKGVTDSYAFNEEYIKFLIDKINSGEYSIDDLNETEQDQIQEYLRKQ